MFNLLTLNNFDLKKETEAIGQLLEAADICSELEGCKNWIVITLSSYRLRIDRNLVLIELKERILLPEIISETQSLTFGIRQISTNFLPPLIRYKPMDTFCLKVIAWLHQQHKQTRNSPFALSDGDFAVYSDLNGPVVYLMPTSSLGHITHLPLIFHELGHYLYVYHKEEMDALVSDLQTRIWNMLKPSYRANNKRHKAAMQKITRVAETWYEWVQEFFCDAVGLHIGGIGYLKTFSIYLRMMGDGEFRLDEADLEGSTHPVSWLRIKLLCHRARQYGLDQQANETLREWSLIASELNIKQDYYGFYDESFDTWIHQTLNDMLTEASPVYFKDYINSDSNMNVIQLISAAWRNLDSNPEDYKDWEKNAIDSFLTAN